MSAIDDLFMRLKAEGRKAFMPFVTAGDPDLEFTGPLLRELVRRGSSLCEVGIPYSDPIADGSVIQASYTRALQRGIRLREILACLGQTTPDLKAPVVTMVSYAIVVRVGLHEYVNQARAAGVAGAIVPDLPVDEAEQFSRICREREFDLIQLVTPTTSTERALTIARTSTGFLYYVSVTGITGERTELPPDLVENVARLKERIELPICIGFGIHHPDHVRLLAPVADGLIVGSAIVKRIAAAANLPREQALSRVGDYVAEMIAALNDA